jgi:hypothetical protein
MPRARRDLRGLSDRELAAREAFMRERAVAQAKAAWGDDPRCADALVELEESARRLRERARALA